MADGHSRSVTNEDVAPAHFVDSDHPAVVDFARRTLDVAGATTERERSVALFLRVRDGYRYDPYGTSRDPEDYRASAVVSTSSNWCVPKSVLLTAAARASGIPARLGFADVRNHLTSEKLSASMGTDLFAWHGYSELLLPDRAADDGSQRWFKLSSAFNIELCERFGVKVLEFDGTDDALMHPYDRAGNRHMEYVEQRGSFDDLPLDRMLADFREMYPGSFGEASAASAEDAGDTAFSAGA
jgi:transglutaminase-like putative cysteine protease